MSTISDMRYALRSLARVPLLTGAAIGSLTLGLAGSTIVFTLVHATMLRQPPFEDADRLAVLNIIQRSPTTGEQRLRWSWPRFRLLQRFTRSFEDIASSSNAVLTITGVDDPAAIRVERVSARYLPMLRAPLVLGAGFARDDDAADASEPRAVIGYSLWQQRFNGAADVVGRTLELNGVPLVIVGVTAKGFEGISGLAEAWVPATLSPRLTYREYLTTNQNFITVIARLRDGVTPEAANEELGLVGSQIHAVQPSEGDTPNDRFSAGLLTLNQARVDVVTRRALLLLSGAALVLLLIACANVASLLLGRAMSRRQEIAIRLAVGVGRWRLVRQLLAESAILAGAAGALSVLLTMWIMAVIRIPPTLARGRNFYGAVAEFNVPAIDWLVLLYAIAASASAVVLCGLIPSLQATRTDVVRDLKAGGRANTERGSWFGSREVVVASQLALSIVLVVSCGLLVTSYARLRSTPMGFEPSGLIAFRIDPSEVRYSPASAPQLIDRMLEEIRAVRGVEAATVDGCAPLSVQCASAALHIVGRQWPNEGDPPTVSRHYVGPEHFAALGARLLRGRAIEPADRAGRPRIAVINEAAWRRYWPDEDPIGKRVWFDGPAAFGSQDSSAEIVGIVANIAYQPLDENPFHPGFFTPYAQFTYPSRMVLVRALEEPEALLPELAAAIRRVDPSLALADVRTMESRARLSWAKQRTQSGVFALIAFAALLLAVTGVYSVTSYLIASRTREIGVRVALGASASHVIRRFMGYVARLGAVGGLAGLLGALVMTRVLRASLYATSPLDPGVFAVAVLILLVSLAAAAWEPIRRALRVSPVEVMRSD